jgi:hypothetical protein
LGKAVEGYARRDQDAVDGDILQEVVGRMSATTEEEPVD